MLEDTDKILKDTENYLKVLATAKSYRTGYTKLLMKYLKIVTKYLKVLTTRSSLGVHLV
jgi:hypothetical protein